jgi:hypothetical protein
MFLKHVQGQGLGVKRKDPTNLQKLEGPSSDALCNGVYVTPLHRASEYGCLEVILVPRVHGTKQSIPRRSVNLLFTARDTCW